MTTTMPSYREFTSAEVRQRRRRLVHVREGPLRLDPDGADAAERLRADEYIDRRGWIGPGWRTAVGGETDEFDDHATHYAVLEDDGPSTVATGTVRLVRPVEGRLPIFDSFPTLAGSSLSVVEVSRYIARDPESAAALRAIILAQLLMTGTTGVAIISAGLYKLLVRQHFELRVLAEPTVVPRYGRWRQVAVAIEAEASALHRSMARMVGAAVDGDLAAVLSQASEARR